MKNRILSPALILFAMLFAFTSCELEDPDDMFGDPVEKFLGNWKCEENGNINGYFGPFNVQVVRNPASSSEILIRNINYQGMSIEGRAIVSGSQITLPRQDICDDTIEIKGSGTFRNGEFTLNYKTNDGADEENISARFFK